MHDEPGSAGSATPADDQAEVLATGQPGGRGEHGASGQAERRARPLPRRAARIARPARVRIRSRNPWVLARRRLLGWKVRLPLLTSGSPGAHCKQVWWCPLPHSHGRRTATATPDESRGRRVTYRHSLARAREDARYQRETIREYAAARRFSNRLAGHPIRRHKGHGGGVTGRFVLWRPPRLVSVLLRGFALGPSPGLPTWRRTVRAELGPRRRPTQCEAPTGLGVPSCTAVDNLWTTWSGRPRHHRM